MKCGVRQIKYNNICHMCKRTSRFELLRKLPQISHIHKNGNFQVKLVVLRPARLFSTNFMAVACKECTFSFLPVMSS